MSPNCRVDAILAQFPGPVTLYPSRAKWLLVFLGCGLFAAGGIWMVATADANGWFVLPFFAIGTIVAGVMLLPGAAALVLERDGFQTTTLFRRSCSDWRDVSEFESVRIREAMRRMVVYDDVNLAGRAMAEISAGFTGRNAGLPDTYGLAAGDLADLMTLWRERALSTSGHPHSR
jgi:hypothetical protein